MIDIAQSEADGFRRRVREIASAQAIPPRYLPQILVRLKAAGFVQSSRGPEGGYVLAVKPSEIAVGDVIAAIDGQRNSSFTGNSCAARNLSDLLERVQSAEHKMLHEVTIAELAHQTAPVGWDI